jgi:hypothetical protein
MEYRGLEYQILQAATPTGWRWIVFLDDAKTKTKTGIERKRTDALARVEKAINRALRGTTSAKPK